MKIPVRVSFTFITSDQLTFNKTWHAGIITRTIEKWGGKDVTVKFFKPKQKHVRNKSKA